MILASHRKATRDGGIFSPLQASLQRQGRSIHESRRLSLVFFHNPNYDAEVTCIPTCLSPGEFPKYDPTTSGEHLRRLFTATQLSAAR